MTGKIKRTVLLAVLAATCAVAVFSDDLRIGWAATDITPDRPAALGGVGYARISQGVMDPLTATALALEADYGGESPQRVILISCDLRSIRDELRDGVRDHLAKTLPEIDSARIVLNATHTHSAPPLGDYGIALDAMDEPEYQAFAIPRIAAAAETAWRRREPGGVSFGLSHAVVGRNRLVAYASGASQMYGATDRADFSHIEGYEDHSVNLLYTWNRDRELTGIMINIAAPSQVSATSMLLSADFWHETRSMLRERLDDNLFILAQCSAAGDQNTKALWDRRADTRMLQLSGRNRRQEIAVRLTEATLSIMPLMKEHIDWRPVLMHQSRTLKLPRRIIGEDDVARAAASAKELSQQIELMRADLEADPTLQQRAGWLREFTRLQWRWRRAQRVEERFELQQRDPYFPTEVHVLRIGDVALATNPFELYLDFGVQIKARSPATQTFVVQLASGSSGYLPTERSVAGGAYGAVPASTLVGPEGGRELVEQTLRMLEEMWHPQVDLIAAEWVLAFEDDFERDEIGEDWLNAENWRIENGKLVSPGGGAVLLTTRNFRGLQRIEMTATARETQVGVSDLSLLIHGDITGDIRSGYFLQFGGRRNTRNGLRRLGDSVVTSSTHRIVPGQAHRVAAELDGNHVRLSVDDEMILEYADDHPLIGLRHQRLGIYTWTPAEIDRIKIYTSEPKAASRRDPR